MKPIIQKREGQIMENEIKAFDVSKPKAKIKATPKPKAKPKPKPTNRFSKQLGNIIYEVSVNFKQGATETLDRKILRLIKNEMRRYDG